MTKRKDIILLRMYLKDWRKTFVKYLSSVNHARGAEPGKAEKVILGNTRSLFRGPRGGRGTMLQQSPGSRARGQKMKKTPGKVVLSS